MNCIDTRPPVESAAARPAAPRWRHTATPMGRLVLAASDQGLTGAWFEGQRHFDGPGAAWSQDGSSAVLDEAEAQLRAWFEGRLKRFDLPLEPVGTAFQQAVWAAIARIAYGRTRSYGEVAAELGQPSASRAVGAATGRNPLSIIVPCHRLVGRGGALTGYAGGLTRKQALLRFEAGEAALFG